MTTYILLNQYFWKDRFYQSYYNELIDKYNYTPKSLLLYIDLLKTYEAIDDMYYIVKELTDYARMMSTISNKFDKYPRNFLTTHRISCRNYTRLRKEFSEELFEKNIKKIMNMDMVNISLYILNLHKILKMRQCSKIIVSLLI